MLRRINWPGFLFLLGVVAVWEAWASIVNSPNMPGFSKVALALVEDHARIARETGYSLQRAAIGFLLALGTMLPLGVFLGRVRAAGALVEPVIEFIRPLPPIAIIPVTMLFLGIGDAARIGVVVYGAAFPILINTIEAVRGSHPMLTNVTRSLRLTRLEQMVEVDLPAALPQIMAGVRIAIASSLLLAVVAEMLIAANGLGTYIVRSQERFQIANNLAALLVIVVLALVINLLVKLADDRLLRWHHVRTGASGH